MAGQVYQGAAGRGARYVGSRTDAQLYLGAGTLFAAHVVPTLPISSVPFQVLYGHQRVFPDYVGPIMRVSGGAGGGLYDVVQNADGTTNTGAAYQAWLGGGQARVETWYDQAGSGRHATQPNEGARPIFDPAYAKQGKTPIFFGLGQFLYVPDSVTGDGRNTTVVGVNDRVTSAANVSGNLAEWQLGGSWNGSGASSMLSAVPNGQRLLSTVFGDYGTFGRSQPETQITSMYPDFSELLINTAYTYTASGRPGTYVGGRIGAGGPGYVWYGSAFIWGVYATQLPEGERQAVRQALATSTDALTSWRAHVLSTGNSIVMGTGGAPGLNNLHFTEKLLTERVAITNMGVFGQRLDTIVSQRGSYIGKFNFYIPLNILVAPEPTNDIDQSGGASDYGQSRWDLLLQFVNDAIAAGWKVLVPTVIKRNWGGDFAAKEANSAFYNDKVMTSLPAGAYPLNYAADNAALNLPDGTHPDTPSYRDLMAPRQAALINQLLASDARDFRSAADFATLVDFQGGTGLAGIAVTRSTPGTATNAAGDGLTSFPANTLRRTDRGALFEEAATNVIMGTDDMSVDPWKTYFDNGGAVSRTPYAGVAPDGSNTATRVDFSRTQATSSFAILFQDIGTGSSPLSYVFVPWVKAATAESVGKQVIATIHPGQSRVGSLITLTDKWQRVPSNSQDYATQVFIGLPPPNGGWGGPSTTGTTSVLIWRGQVEAGVPTSTMVGASRAADDATYTVPAGIDRLVIRYESGDVPMLVTAGSTITLPRQGYATRITAPRAAA